MTTGQPHLDLGSGQLCYSAGKHGDQEEQISQDGRDLEPVDQYTKWSRKGSVYPVYAFHNFILSGLPATASVPESKKFKSVQSPPTANTP